MFEPVRRPASIVMALAVALAAAPAVHARGGGGCVARGTAVLTPAGPVAIESLHRGDEIWSAAPSGLRRARVDALFETTPERYVEIAAGGSVLRITPGHPVMTAPGEFTLVERLVPGDALYRERD
jgi:hypothetical protein